MYLKMPYQRRNLWQLSLNVAPGSYSVTHIGAVENGKSVAVVTAHARGSSAGSAGCVKMENPLYKDSPSAAA
jgi:hypothetical protein